MSRKSKSFIAIALVCLLCFATVGTAFAIDVPVPAEVAISKELRLPEGTNIPAATFNFIATAVSVDEGAPTGAPPLQNLSVTFPGQNAHTSTANNITSRVLETGNIFAGVTFPHAGVYVYTLKEQENTYTASAEEWLSYSPAEYELTVLVANHPDGGLYVHSVAVKVITDNAGEDVEEEGDKVDPTPGGDGEDTFYSQLIFTNNYVKTPVEPNPEPAVRSALFVSKTVAGDFGSREQYFSFNVSLSVPDLGQPIPPFFRAYVVEGNTVVTNIADNAGNVPTGTDSGGAFIQMSTSAATTIQLKHGQRLVFVDTPVGTSYTVTETAAVNYTPSAIVITGGVTPGTNFPGTLGQELSTGAQLVGETPSDNANPNSAAFTNTRDSITPTGLNLNDLPFILLIALGVGALATFIVVKVRKSKQYN